MAKVVNTATGQDALLSGTYTLEPTDHVLSMGVDGEADTFFELPALTDWLLVEVFYVEEIDGDLSYHEWTDDVRDIPAKLTSIQALVDNDSAVTYYRVVITHYNSTTTKVNVYRGHNLSSGYEALCLDASDGEMDFTFPVGDWIITSEVLAPDKRTTLYPRGYTYPSICTYPSTT